MNKAILGSAAGVALLAGTVTSLLASSHREAPAIARDQYADNTDVYAFITPSDPNRIAIIANYVPLLLAPSGPNFYKFDPNARYDINIDNDGDAKADIIYRFTFDNSVLNGNTFLYNTGPVTSIDDPDLNVRQVYELQRIEVASGRRTKLGSNIPIAPWNVGKNSFPNYDAVAQQAVRQLGTTTVFAGPRDEAFFVDLHVFDLLGVGGVPTTDNLNVMSIALEVPITDLAYNRTRPAAGATGKTSVVGIYASASRQELRLLRRSNDEVNLGNFVQVSRLGLPLVNEVIIPLKNKDKFNRSKPHDDVANFGAHILDPEVPKLLAAVLGLPCPATPAGGRTDLVTLLSPNGTTAADLLRININAGQTNEQSAFPNGRAPEDDVTDTLLTVACNSRQANGTLLPVGDNVGANDKPFLNVMPYLPSPLSGNP